MNIQPRNDNANHQLILYTAEGKNDFNILVRDVLNDDQQAGKFMNWLRIKLN